MDGKNIRIEYRWAEDRVDRIKALAADALRRPVAAIAANSVSALTAKTLTATVPIVFQSGVDPVAAGLVASLGHPGGNVTGVSFFASTMETKKLELLRELLPDCLRRGAGQPEQSAGRYPGQRYADCLGYLKTADLIVVKASQRTRSRCGFSTSGATGCEGAGDVGDAFLNSRRQQLIALAASTAVPAIYSNRENVEDGGLITYGAASRRPTVRWASRRTGAQGSQSGRLPVVQPTKFEMIINLKTARSLGLIYPRVA